MSTILVLTKLCAYRVRRSVRSRRVTCSRSFPISRPRRVLGRTSSSCWTLGPRSTRNRQRVKSPLRRRCAGTSASRTCTSGTPPVPACVSCAICRSRSSLALILRLLALVGQARVLRECPVPLICGEVWFVDVFFVFSIQLIERFYDPLAGEIYVCVVIDVVVWVCADADIRSLTASASRI